LISYYMPISLMYYYTGVFCDSCYDIELIFFSFLNDLYPF